MDDEITMVHHLIEHHILHYMTKSETVASLSENYNIEPRFTELVWERLESDNSEFFEAYNLSLGIISQINLFNELLEQLAMAMDNCLAATRSEPASSSNYSVATEESVNSGETNQESSCGSTSWITYPDAQNSGEKQDNGTGGGGNGTPSPDN